MPTASLLGLCARSASARQITFAIIFLLCNRIEPGKPDRAI